MTGARRLEGAVTVSGLLLLLTVGRVEAQAVDAPRCGAGVHEAQATGTVGFPEDQIFCPLVADPKEARSFVSFLHGTFRSLDDPTGEGTSIASVGVGDSFGLVRWGGPEPGEGVQVRDAPIDRRLRSRRRAATRRRQHEQQHQPPHVSPLRLSLPSCT